MTLPCAAAIAFAATLTFAAPSMAQQAPQPQPPRTENVAAPTPLSTLDPARLTLDQIEQAIGRDGIADAALGQQRTSLEPIRDDLRAATEGFEQRLGDVDARRKQLGDPPAFGAPPEDPAIAAERTRLNQRRGEIDAALKQARLLTLRADDLAERITEKRRNIFTRELFGRSSSALDPSFWAQTAGKIPETFAGVVWLLRSWWNFARDSAGYSRIFAALLTLTALATGVFMLAGWVKRHVTPPALSGTRFSHAFMALITLLRTAITMPVLVGGVVLILEGFDLLPTRIMEIGLGLIAATGIASFGRGVGVALFAADEPGRRLLAMRDTTARLMTRHLTWAARVLGTIVFINVVLRALAANVSLTVATSIILAVTISALLCHFLIRIGSDIDEEDEVSGAQWLRGAGWLLVAAIAVSLVTGFIGLAGFLAGRFLVALGVIGALYICLVVTDTLFTDILTANTPRGRKIAGFFGLKPRSIELVGTLLSAVIRLLLILVVLLPLLGPWGVFAADILSVLRDAAFGFKIGDITISITGILSAAALLFVGIVATRSAQRWLQTHFLPRTSLDPGLQNSVSTIFGYVCIIAVIGLTLAAVGIDLQKITLVAGALSIGIGFGLQAVVSNFISGLILLAERPIRVGDIINVKGEEGQVRRIHVRATEIETADRASVIVPNSELITGMVKNWTHANTLSRVVVRIGVGYDSDVEKVRAMLLEIAGAHQHLMTSPGPSVFLTSIADSAINFELSGVVRNIADAAGVKSDLYFEILKRFRAEGITIPNPMREVVWREPPAALKGKI
jgi:small-conductance mechanosensitive channel